jgi:hypothetical protein
VVAQITADDVNAYLSELGYTIPAAVLTPILCRVNSIIPCIEGAGYDECTQQLILLYCAALMATTSGARRIKSQGAPNGASRSFDYGDNLELLSDALKKLDPNGCTSDLPLKVDNTVGYFDVVGGFY